MRTRAWGQLKFGIYLCTSRSCGLSLLSSGFACRSQLGRVTHEMAGKPTSPFQEV